jgi:hypothetical protein
MCVLAQGASGMRKRIEKLLKARATENTCDKTGAIIKEVAARRFLRGNGGCSPPIRHKEAERLRLRSMQIARECLDALAPVRSPSNGTSMHTGSVGTLAQHVPLVSAHLSLASLFSLYADEGPSDDAQAQMEKVLEQALELFNLEANEKLFQSAQIEPLFSSAWEEWTSQLAVLALHIYFVRTHYGTKKLNPVESLALPGMRSMCEFLLKFLHASRQPERFFEGLVLLYLCGYSVDAETLLASWFGGLSEKVIWPLCVRNLRVFAQSKVPTSKTDRQSGGEADTLMHLELVVQKFIRARGQVPKVRDELLRRRDGQDWKNNGIPFTHLALSDQARPSAWDAQLSKLFREKPDSDKIEVLWHRALSIAGKPAQAGLFVRQDASPAPSVERASRHIKHPVFRKDDRVCFYGGLICDGAAVKRYHADHWLPKESTHGRGIPSTSFVLDAMPFVGLLRRPLVPSGKPQNTWWNQEATKCRVACPKLEDFTGTEEEAARILGLYEATPKGFFANTADTANHNIMQLGDCSTQYKPGNNVKIEYERIAGEGKGIELRVPFFTASRDIFAGEEILSPYNNHDMNSAQLPAIDEPVPISRACKTGANVSPKGAATEDAHQRRGRSAASTTDDDGDDDHSESAAPEPTKRGVVSAATNAKGRKRPKEAATTATTDDDDDSVASKPKSTSSSASSSSQRSLSPVRLIKFAGEQTYLGPLNPFVLRQ